MSSKQPMPRCTPGTSPDMQRVHRDAPADGTRPGQQHDRDPQQPAARRGECSGRGMRIDGEPAPRSGDPREPRLGDRRRLRHHDSADCICAGMALGQPRRARAPPATAATPYSIPLLWSSCASSPRHPAIACVSDDVEVAGSQFKEGERLWISWAMANRDPSVFTEPDKIVLQRKGNRHFSFGIGVHRYHRVQRGAHGVQIHADPGAGQRLGDYRWYRWRRPLRDHRRH